MNTHQIDYKIASMHAKLANAESTIRELHRLIDEFRAWLRESMEEKKETRGEDD